MNPLISRKYRRWLRTRDLRQLWLSVPALLALLGWGWLWLCLSGWRPGEIEGAYSKIAQQAITARDFETARIAAQRLLSVVGTDKIGRAHV